LRATIPVRTILATIGLVLLGGLVLVTAVRVLRVPHRLIEERAE
jgi:hypothetical protein